MAGMGDREEHLRLLLGHMNHYWRAADTLIEGFAETFAQYKKQAEWKGLTDEDLDNVWRMWREGLHERLQKVEAGP